MTIDVNELRGRLRALADEAADKARHARERDATNEAQFQAGRHAALVTALSQLTLSEQDAARERDAGFGQGVDLGAVGRLEEFARNAGGAVDMASGTVYSDADEGL